MDLPHVSGLSWLAGGSILAALATGWRHIKDVFSRFTHLFIVNSELQDGLGSSVVVFLLAHGKLLRLGKPRQYAEGTYYNTKKDGKRRLEAYEQITSATMVFYYQGALILMTKGGSGLRYIRGSIKGEKLIVDATKYWTDHYFVRKGRYTVHRLLGSGVFGRSVGNGDTQKALDSDGASTSVRETYDQRTRFLDTSRDDIFNGPPAQNTVDRLALSPDVMDAVEEMRRWKDAEYWFTKKKVPWRRGWLLFGPPGTGKSSVANAIAHELDIPIFSLVIGSMSNNEFISAWTRASKDVPALVLIEDIDAVFKGRENIAVETGGLDFSTLLNAISGVVSSNGVFTIVTTNKIECVDEALGTIGENGLSSRPGRLDRVIKLGNLTEDGRKKIADRILSDESEELRNSVVAQYPEVSGAQFQEVCTTLAVKRFWERAKPEVKA